MGESLHYPEVRQDLIGELRAAAGRGARVRELVGVIHDRLSLPAPAVVPVMVHLTEAFHVPLRAVLPIREWLGTDQDAEIDALILAAIDKTKAQWMYTKAPQEQDGDTGRAVPGLDVATAK